MYTRIHAKASTDSKPSSLPLGRSLAPKSSLLVPEHETLSPKETDRGHSPELSSTVSLHRADLGYSFGNLAIGPQERLGIQAKLTIGQPHDRYEQEADRVADRVMRISAPIADTMPVNPIGQSSVQRICPECEEDLQRQPQQPDEEEKKKKYLQRQPLASTITPLVQRQVTPPQTEDEDKKKRPLQRQVKSPNQEDEEKKKRLQKKATSEASPDLAPGLQERLSRLQQGGGQPLSPTERSFFEPRFGHDLSPVKIHTDERAADMARSVNARAFTVGQDVVFGAGQYQPRSTEGQRLLAHELVHTIQQSLGTSKRTQMSHCSSSDSKNVDGREAQPQVVRDVMGQPVESCISQGTKMPRPIQRQVGTCPETCESDAETHPLIYNCDEASQLGRSEQERCKRPAVGYAQKLLNNFLRKYDNWQSGVGSDTIACVGDTAKIKALRASLPTCLNVDCWFGDQTYRATRMFQLCDGGLKDDGKIGEKTWPALETMSGNSPVPKPKVSPNQIPPSTEEKCKLTIYSELPSEGSVGHAFLRIESPQKGTLVRGFWPACAKCSSTENCSSLEIRQIIFAKGAGRVCDDSDERGDDKITYDLRKNQCEAIHRFIAEREKNPPKYGALWYNCVDFVNEAAKTAGINIPGHFLSGISEPEDLANFFKKQRSRMDGLGILASNSLKIVQDSQGEINLNTGASFRTEPRPIYIDALEYRWIIIDGQDNRYLMWGDNGSVFEYSSQPRAYIPSQTRLLLKQRGIKNATIRCRVQVYYNAQLVHGGINEQVVLSLPVTFN